MGSVVSFKRRFASAKQERDRPSISDESLLKLP